MLKLQESGPQQPLRHIFDIGAPVPGEGPLQIVADIFLPLTLAAQPCVLFCLPGGGVTRNYFHLDAGQNGASTGDDYSFALQMAAQGHVALTFDPLGVGESSRPENGFALTPELLVTVQRSAMQQAITGLQDGTLVPGFAPLPDFVKIGAGHSMGALLTILQQDSHHDFDALFLLCFGSIGLPQILNDAEQAALQQPDKTRSQLAELASLRFGGNPYPPIMGKEPTSPASIALGKVQDRVLALPAMLAMLPGNVAPELARLDVPVFLAVCTGDMTGPPHLMPQDYPSCPDLTLFALPLKGHHPFVSALRHKLFDRLAAWLPPLL